MAWLQGYRHCKQCNQSESCQGHSSPPNEPWVKRGKGVGEEREGVGERGEDYEIKFKKKKQ